MKYLLENQETLRTTFRPVSMQDFDAWLAFFQEPLSHQHWIRNAVVPIEECKNWYDRQFSRYENDEGGMNAIIEKSTNKLLGHAGLLIQHVDGKTEMEIAYSLLPEYWGKGFAIEAARKCKDYAFENDFSDSLISIISLTNTPSSNVAVKNGMTIDIQTVYHDNQVNIYRVKKDDWKNSKSD